MVFFRNTLLIWFDYNKRSFPWRKFSSNNFKNIISEIFLQRTKAETVAKFVPLFLRIFPSWKRIALVSREDLELHLKPIGLWKKRASSLKNLAIEMVRRNGRFPKTREEIEKLPGVGQYIANAILMFCHGESQPLLDTNMARVLERYFGPRKLADIRYDPYLQKLSKNIVKGKNPQTINWAILDFAALVCKIRSPLCGSCPLANKCQSAFLTFPR